MLDLSQARLTTLAVHKVGNKIRNEGFTAARERYPLEEPLSLVLQEYFLNPFKAEEYFKFAHPADLNLNELYTYCRQIFGESRERFLEFSAHILQHLYDQSVHPHIKGGELYVAHFRECVIDGVQLEAVGIFKSEHKDVFLRLGEADSELQLTAEEGVNIKRLDKGCLIFNTFADDGFSLLMVDKDSEDARYWRDDFLRVERIQDNSYHTQHFMSLTREYCDEVFSREQDKKEQVVFLNKSLNYFNKNKEFDLENFRESVFATPEQWESFDQFRKESETAMGLPPAEEGFAISKYAVRRMKKEFKPLIRLDTEVEIRMDPRKTEEASEYIERGFDQQRGMYYYKIFFNEEMD
ncbi:MAG: nucleoid-associated protein [Bacteroidia bacterium]|nr:nucleoid-associated protein [Bacteroidia bacterium]